MAGEVNLVKGQPQTPAAQDHAVRVGEWREFDAIGANLPRRSAAVEWRNTRALLLVCGAVMTAAIFWTLYRVVGVYMFFCWGAFASPSAMLGRRLKQRIYQRALGEAEPSDTVVAASYQIDGFEYGRDVGRFNIENGWLFFEGERSTFSLGQDDVALEFVHPSQWLLGTRGYGLTGHSVLQLRGGDCCVTIRLDPISQTVLGLQNELTNWCSAGEPTEGIALLPPMEPSQRGDFSKSDRLWPTVWTGALTAFIGYVLAVFMFGLSDGSMAAFIATVVTGAVAGFGWESLRVRRGRPKAFRHLAELRGRLETPPIGVLGP